MSKPLNLGEDDVLATLKAYFKAASTRISELEEELDAMKAKETAQSVLRDTVMEDSRKMEAKDGDREVKELTMKLALVQKTCDELQAENDYLGANGRNATFLHDHSQDISSSTGIYADYEQLQAENERLSEEVVALNGSLNALQTKFEVVQDYHRTVVDERERWQAAVSSCSLSNTDGEPGADYLYGDEDVNGEEDEHEEPQTPEMTATSHSGKDTAVRTSEHEGKSNAAFERCRYFLKNLPREERRPTLGDIHRICSAEEDLFTFLSQDPVTQAFIPEVFYLPGRVVTTSDLNIVAFGPTSPYDAASRAWHEGSDLRVLDGAIREVFVDRGTRMQQMLVYVGTFKFYDLHSQYTRKALMAPKKVKFPNGFITVEAMGLHCIGFNRAFYEALCARNGVDPDVGPATARKLERQAAGGGKGKKGKGKAG
ncbi:hypothetical protein C8F01DRAFT_1134284 [Mycena amicta]|nr:hypothetical protein C8F01DRAFT_1134284 [Mycena amicta]